eukprot:jgi/Bigna1/64639/fgenesh1_kg.81_\
MTRMTIAVSFNAQHKKFICYLDLVFVLSKANYLRVKVVLFLPSWHGVLHAGIAVVINTMAVVSMILIL